jgi:hypothetical protein
MIQTLNLLDARPEANKDNDIANSNDYTSNRRMLTIIQWCVFTLSAVATGVTNTRAHYNTIGIWGAIPLVDRLKSFST